MGTSIRPKKCVGTPSLKRANGAIILENGLRTPNYYTANLNLSEYTLTIDFGPLPLKKFFGESQRGTFGRERKISEGCS